MELHVYNSNTQLLRVAWSRPITLDSLRRHFALLVANGLYKLKPVPSAYISYFSAFFDSPKSTLKLFSTEEAALRWLEQQKDLR